MKDALKSFALIVTALVIATAFAWFYFYNRGLGQPIHPLVSPFFEGHPRQAVIAYGGDSNAAPENTWPAFDAAVALGPEVILWADVEVTKDRTAVIFREKDVSRVTGSAGWINYLSDAEVAKLDPGFTFGGEAHPFRAKGLRIPTLAEFLSRYPKHRIVLNFVEYTPGLDETIVAVVRAARAAGRILFQSDIDGLSRDLREREAMWLYGESRPQATRFIMLSSLGLGPAAKMRGDVYVTPPRVGARKSDLIDDDQLAELARRKMPVFAGPVRDEAEAKALFARGVAGVISADPAAAARALGAQK